MSGIPLHKSGLCLFAFAAWAMAQTLPETRPLATVEGQVIHAATGSPVRKTKVNIQKSTGDDSPTLIATTDSSGTFRFVDLQPGSYRLWAEKPGFLESKFGQNAPDDDQSLLALTATDHLTGLSIKLFPSAIITFIQCSSRHQAAT